MVDEISEYGWTAVPRDVEKLLKGKKNIKDPKPVSVSSIKVPVTPLAKAIQQYARDHLPEETYNHSMRVYFYGKLKSAGIPKIRGSLIVISGTLLNDYRHCNYFSAIPRF